MMKNLFTWLSQPPVIAPLLFGFCVIVYIAVLTGGAYVFIHFVIKYW
jgi:hypothetical protein